MSNIFQVRIYKLYKFISTILDAIQMYISSIKYLLLLLLLKVVGSAWLRESDIHPISPKTIIVGIEQLRPIEKHWPCSPASPTPSNTGSARSFQRDTERGIKVLRGSAARRSIRMPMCDQGTACNLH